MTENEKREMAEILGGQIASFIEDAIDALDGDEGMNFALTMTGDVNDALLSEISVDEIVSHATHRLSQLVREWVHAAAETQAS